MAEGPHPASYEPAPFAVRVSPGPEPTVAVQGELDIATVAQFEAAIVGIERGALRRVILDLRGLQFIDLIGLRAVLALRNVCLRTSVALAILPGPRRVQRIFELTGTDRLLAICGGDYPPGS